MPISQGLVLTSGTADGINGPVSGFARGGGMGPGDLDLNAELGGIYPTYDACVLEFDRVPIGKPVPMACVRNGQLELTFFDGSQGANAMIFDAMGRAVRNFPIAGSAMNVEIASFFPGGYALRVETLEGPVVRRFAKD